MSTIKDSLIKGILVLLAIVLVANISTIFIDNSYASSKESKYKGFKYVVKNNKVTNIDFLRECQAKCVSF